MILTKSFRLDQKGAVAFEAPFVYSFLIFVFLLPLADLAAFGFQYVSAYEALRNLGQYAQYNVPQDVTSWSAPASWASNTNYTIATSIYCGDTTTVCVSNPTATPKYYAFSTTITLNPLVLKPVLCVSGAANPCSYTLTYTERFQ